MEQIVVNGVFIGKVEETWGGLVSAIDKLPVEQEFWLGHDGLPGDEQADIRHHGGLERALHHYPAEHYRYWRKRHPLNRWQLPAFGENISTYGITEAEVCIGDQFHWGDALLEVSQPRSPCYRQGQRWNLPELPDELQSGGRCGWFYRVLRSGMVTPGDELKLVQRHYPELTVARLLQWYFGDPLEPLGLRQMMACDALSQRWRKTAAKRLSSGVVEDWAAPARTVGLPGACLLSDYLITLSQSGRLLASMTVSAARFAEVRELMRQRFPAGDGFELRIETRRESRRLLEQGPQGVRLLAVEYMTEELKDG